MTYRHLEDEWGIRWMSQLCLGGLQRELPFRVEAYDGSVAMPMVASPATTDAEDSSREALTRVLTIPVNWCRAAYVAGDLDIDGELDALFDLTIPPIRSLLKIENLRALLSSLASTPCDDCATEDRSQTAWRIAQPLA